MKITVDGNKESLQSSLDFYLKISSFQGYRNLDEMRSKLFNKFMEEEMSSNTSTLDSRGVIPTKTIEDNSEMEDFILDFLDAVNGGYVENGIYVEDYRAVENPKKENIKSTNYEYTDTGRYVEDYERVKEITQKENLSEDRYTVIEEIIEEPEDLDGDSVEDTNNDLIEDFNIEDIWQDVLEEVSVQEDIVEDVELEEEVNELIQEEELKELISEEEVKEEESFKIDKKEVAKENKELGYKKEDCVKEENKELKEDVILKPSNIRDFLRQHPNSDISFVMKYYSKKEIEKALALGKIYKKKGKLMI